MRNSLAGLLFGIAFVCASVAISGFMLQRSAFDPDNTRDSAYQVLGDSRIRAEVVNLIADDTFRQLGQTSPAPVAVQLDAILDLKDGSALVADIIADAHAHLIGQSDDPVVITPEDLVQITRNESAAAAPPITLDVPRVGSLALASSVFDLLVPITAIATVLFVVLGFFAHPEKGAMLRTLAVGLVMLAVLVAVFGYALPKFIPSLLDNSVWARVPARLADDSRGLVIAMVLLLLAGGAALFFASTRVRRNKRWSSPISTYRYREERRWS